MVLLNDTAINYNKFNDGTFNMTHLSLAQSTNTAMIKWAYETIDEFFQVHALARHLRDKLGIEYLSLYMPYIPNARMDRIEDPNKEVFTLKYFAELVNACNFDRVYVLDPHSWVSESLINNMTIVELNPILETTLADAEVQCLCFPDVGAMHRYADLGMKNDLPRLYGSKVRDWNTREVKQLIINNPMSVDLTKLEGTSVMVIDDICSEGTTAYRVIKALKKLKFAKVFLYVTHLEYTAFTNLNLMEAVDKIYTTNSIYHKEHPKVTVIEFN